MKRVTYYGVALSIVIASASPALATYNDAPMSACRASASACRSAIVFYGAAAQKAATAGNRTEQCQETLATSASEAILALRTGNMTLLLAADELTTPVMQHCSGEAASMARGIHQTIQDYLNNN